MPEPQVRHAVRVLLIDQDERVLLFRAQHPNTGGVFWLTPGGGIEPGEDVRTAARRELHEEVGRDDIALGAEVWRRRVVFSWHDKRYDQRERWFLARVEHFTPDMSGMLDYEREELSQWRWWTLPELEESPDRLVPRSLPAGLRKLLREGPPDAPIEIED